MLTYLTFNGMRGVLPCVHSHVLVNSASQVSWRPIEERLTQPYNLTNVIYSNIPQKIVKRDFCRIITYIFMVWYKVNKLAKTDKFFCQSPVFHNYSLLIDGKPIIFPQWSDKGVHSIQDIMDYKVLHEFKDLQKTYNQPGTAFFFVFAITFGHAGSWCTVGHTMSQHGRMLHFL